MDPIGSPPNVSRIIDRYDFYFETSFLLLKQAATTAEIENYLHPVKSCNTNLNLLLNENKRSSMKIILLFLLLTPSISFADNFLVNSNKLFDYAEKSYPEFFSPAGMKTITLDNYLVRYYPNTGNYIGTTSEDVYVYGDIFNGLLKVGAIPDFIELEPDGDKLLATLFSNGKSNMQVYGTGTVVSILSDDLDGSPHQRFIIELNSKQTLLVSHNIDLSPRIDALSLNDHIEFFGEYEWNDKGGIVHWTHHDPAGIHVGGWILHNNIIYQ